ncbi:MAG: carboxy terminal-processing peptidase [Pseudomonadota bacterium]
MSRAGYSRLCINFPLKALASSLLIGLAVVTTSSADVSDKASELPVLEQEKQHSIAAKRISNTFARAHYKKFDIDDELSKQIFTRYIDALDANKHFFLQSDVNKFDGFKTSFDDAVRIGDLSIAYSIYMLNLERRKERFKYAITLLDEAFNFEKEGDKFFYDREDADWPTSRNEINEVWRQRVKYDALSLKLADKTDEEIKDILTKRYNRAIRRLSQTNSEDVFQTVMNSFARSIEAHTSYLSPSRTERFQMDMNLSLEGIGAVLRTEDDHTTVVSVVAGGPADKNGQIKPEDKILGVAQEDEKTFIDVVGWRLDDVVDLIKGPKGSIVKLQVQKGGSTAKKVMELEITRDKVKLEDKAAKSDVIKDESGQSIGVIDIPSFYHNLHVDVRKLLDELKAQQVKGVIVDLRGNGGGSLPEAIALSGLFIEKGPIVQIRHESGQIEVNYDRDGQITYDGPLTVLVDRFSASASEIFAAAMQDFNRAIIIGEQTFGKGTVQQHRPLGRIYDFFENKLGAVQYTMAKFYRISGGSTQHKGVLPDISYPSPIVPEEWGESREENALPWDSIQKAKYNQVTDSHRMIDMLTAKHNARALKDPEFQYIFQDIEEYKENKDKNYISLVASERIAENEASDIKRLNRINERLDRLGLTKIESLDDDLPEVLDDIDPFLDEAIQITGDMIASGSYALNI